jgi:hypothetical protein
VWGCRRQRAACEVSTAAEITYDYLATFDVRQADYAIAYIKQHAKDDKPWFCRQFAFSRVYESVNH